MVEKSLLVSSSFNTSCVLNNGNIDLDQTKIFSNLSINQNNSACFKKDDSDPILASDMFNEIKVS